MSAEHDPDFASVFEGTVERAPETPRPGQSFSTERAAAARRAADIIGNALAGRPTATAPQIGRRLGVNQTNALRLVRGVRAWLVGDLLLMANGDFEAVIAALRAARSHEVAALSIDRRVRRLSMRVGDLARCVDSALVDQRVDEHEQREIDQHVLGIAVEAQQAVGGR
jgi:hypothetical protein